MIEAMMEWAAKPSAAWWVLAGAALIIVIEAARVSKTTLWGDMIDDDE
ncbi:MAG: hypothetical protein QNI84_10085 [Henriciella sp.]|nr:hypothetical protein [Henriciella sp.]